MKNIIDFLKDCNKIIGDYSPNVKCVRCKGCGKFISYKAIEDHKAKYHFIPDSQFGPEENYWECEKCK